MSATGRRLIAVVAIGMNLFVIPICFFFGFLGVMGRLADTSVRENWITGLQLLAVGAIALANCVTSVLLQKPPVALVYGLNVPLVLFAIYYWIVDFRLYGDLVPPLDSVIPFLIASTTIVHLLNKPQWH